MLTTRRLIRIALSSLMLGAALLLANGCKPKSHPAPFTAQLIEIAGVQAVYTLRHPKLILADLDLLMAKVPEAALLKMGLAQLTPYGYPEFSEITAGSTIGVALLTVTPEAISEGKPALVAFAQLKEGGKIWTALTKSGLTLEKRNDWTWIAKDPAVFAQLKSPDALLAYIARPQTEELRFWGRVSPELLVQAKALLVPKITEKLADRPAADQKAYLAYFDVIWGYVAQLHSGTASLDFNDRGIVIASAAQFLPDSPMGTLLRYPAGIAPKIAQFIPADGLMSFGSRLDNDALVEFSNGFFDALIAVDSPTISAGLKTAKANYLLAAKHSDGGFIGTVNMGFPVSGKEPAIDLFMVQSGKFTEADVLAAQKSGTEFGKQVSSALLSCVSSLVPQVPMPAMNYEVKENALTINGTRFGSIATTTTDLVGEKNNTVSTSTQYFGVVNSNLVIGTNPESLTKKVPAIAAKTVVTNPVQLTFLTSDVMIMTVQGVKIVDLVASSVKADLSDADIQAQLKTLSDGYVTGGPVTISLAASQAEARVTYTIPYGFIAQSVRLAQFASAFDGKTPAAQAKAPRTGATKPQNE